MRPAIPFSPGLLGLACFSVATLGAPQDLWASDDNIRISNLYSESDSNEYWNVSSSTDRQQLFQDLSRDLGMAVSHRNILPAETLGANGFEVSMDTTVMFLPPGELDDVVENSGQSSQSLYDHQNAWRVMDADHRLTLGNALLMPALRVRKGLPFSTEVGADWTWLSFSHQSALSGYGRVAFHEGMRDGLQRLIPDVAFTLAGTSFLGNEEFDLSVFEWNLSIGWTLPVSGLRDSRVGTLSPFMGLGIMYISSIPVGPYSGRLNCLTGATGLGGQQRGSDEDSSSSCSSYDSTDERPVVLLQSFRPWKFNLGARLTSGRFRWILGLELRGDRTDEPEAEADASFIARPTLTLGGGFVY